MRLDTHEHIGTVQRGADPAMPKCRRYPVSYRPIERQRSSYGSCGQLTIRTCYVALTSKVYGVSWVTSVRPITGDGSPSLDQRSLS